MDKAVGVYGAAANHSGWVHRGRMANNFTDKANFIWTVADLIRDDFKRGKYQDIILPLTVLRRIDGVLEPSKDKVLGEYEKYKDKLKDIDPILRKASGYVFYNTSRFTFARLLNDPDNLAKNLNAYINGFSQNMREVIDHFDFRNTIAKLDAANLLYLVMQRFNEIDLRPDVVDNHEMGTIFEELIRRFNEALDENPGEHFTPREVVNLMVMLLFAVENDILQVPQRVVKLADPACGTGGMLTIAKEQALAINPDLQVYLYGQEVNPETFAVCKSDLYMKSADGRDAENIAFGSTLSNDAHANETFDYQLANPPYGKEWKRDEAAVKAEAAKPGGRFSAGTPRISDGQLLFLQHMLSHMNPVEAGGGRVAIVMNGSPLFTGDAGSGESEIRRWILENDWLESIVALPEQLFYNTGIATYIWILSNHKADKRRGKVQLIDATAFWKPMRKSLGDKRREMSAGDLAKIVDLYRGFEEGPHSKIFVNTDFGYRKITVERPLRLNFQVSEERLARLTAQKAFEGLAVSKKKDAKERAKEEQEGREQQEAILRALRGQPGTLFTDREQFEQLLSQMDVTLAAPIKKAILTALSERDEMAAICLDKDGQAEPDPDLRDTENVPLSESVETFFEREVLPHVPDAWINQNARDEKDGQVGKIGYEINFNRYFYEYQPPRDLDVIEAEIKTLEKEILEMLREVTE
jgi:type I restriction enzyme M protein